MNKITNSHNNQIARFDVRCVLYSIPILLQMQEGVEEKKERRKKKLSMFTYKTISRKMKLKEAKRIYVLMKEKRLKTNGTQGRWLNRIDDSNT